MKTMKTTILAAAVLVAAGAGFAEAQTLASYLDRDRTIAYAATSGDDTRNDVWDAIRQFLEYELGLPIDEIEDLSIQGSAFAVTDLPRAGEAGFAIEVGGAPGLRFDLERLVAGTLPGWESSTEDGVAVWRRGERTRAIAGREDEDRGRLLFTNRLELARRWREREVRETSLADRLGSGPVAVHLDSRLLLERLAGRERLTEIADLVPGVRDRRIRRNESAARELLLGLVPAEERFKATTLVDTDADGTGEYGYFQELAGTAPCRSSGQLAEPPILPAELGSSAEANGGIVEKSGYLFLLYLPAVEGPAVRERAPLPDEKDANADLQETRWVCYAWPVEPGRTGRRVFAITAGGELRAARDAGSRYGGLERIPEAGAAFTPAGEGGGGDLGTRFAPEDGPAADGLVWELFEDE